MHKFNLLLVLFLAALTGNCLPVRGQESADESMRQPGALVVVGGGRVTPEIRETFVRLAGGEEARIAILPQASNLEDRGSAAVREFQRWGCDVFAVELDDVLAARQQLDQATGIWMPGGDQSRLYEAIAAAGLVKYLQQRHAAGVVFGGTSAGAAILSERMITGSPDVERLSPGNTPCQQGLGLAPGVVFDQHFVARRRLNRLLSAVLDQPQQIGVGIDEATAIVMEGGQLKVLGDSTVVIIDGRNAAVEDTIQARLHSARGIRVHVLVAGQTFRMDVP